jgi:hypothetical protein
MKSRLRNLLIFVVTTFSLSSLAVAQEHPQVHDETGTWIDAGATLVVVPKSRKIIAAYSVPKATWARLEFDPPLEKEVKVANVGALAAFQTKDSVYAFSAATATWGHLKLPMDTKAQFGLDNNKVRVTDGNMLYIFGVNDGAWSGISLDSGEAITLKK